MPNASVPLNIPGITFGPEGFVNGKMAPEITLSSFLRELGRATYMRSNPNGTEEVAAETAAILFLLEAPEKEGLDELAYREARVITEMAAAEPYRSTVAKIANHPIWIKYSSQARP